MEIQHIMLENILQNNRKLVRDTKPVYRQRDKIFNIAYKKSKNQNLCDT